MSDKQENLTAGEILKRTRTTGRRKRELSTISKQLCIKEEFLDALESGEYAKIPELVYILGFARNYSIELGLDPAVIVGKIKEEMGIVSSEESENQKDKELSDKKVYINEKLDKTRKFMRKNWKWLSTIIISLIVIILAIWAIAKLLPVYDNNNKPDTEQTALYSPEFNLPVKEEFGEKNKATATVAIQATQESWVKIEDAQGETIFSRVLVPGEVYYVPVGSIKGTFGNAGGIDVWVNGVAAPKLGAPHTRKSGVIMTPESLMPQM
ncbi:MAG: helix-turn-helix domain-containing protein [Alphaproteobacteria bacterium]|jgi:hypothetical protein